MGLAGRLVFICSVAGVGLAAQRLACFLACGRVMRAYRASTAASASASGTGLAATKAARKRARVAMVKRIFAGVWMVWALGKVLVLVIEFEV